MAFVQQCIWCGSNWLEDTLCYQGRLSIHAGRVNLRNTIKDFIIGDEPQ